MKPSTQRPRQRLATVELIGFDSGQWIEQPRASERGRSIASAKVGNKIGAKIGTKRRAIGLI